METLNINYDTIYYGYSHIIKTIFKSATINSTSHFSSTLKQCHVIVGDYQGGRYPFVALFVPLNEVLRCLIKEFFEKTTDLRYSFEFITIDMDRRIIAAILETKRLGPQYVQFCL